MKKKTKHARALELAIEYRRLIENGNASRAARVRQAIEYLVGRYRSGQFQIPSNIQRAMGWKSRA